MRGVGITGGVPPLSQTGCKLPSRGSKMFWAAPQLIMFANNRQKLRRVLAAFVLGIIQTGKGEAQHKCQKVHRVDS